MERPLGKQKVTSEQHIECCWQKMLNTSHMMLFLASQRGLLRWKHLFGNLETIQRQNGPHVYLKLSSKEIWVVYTDGVIPFKPQMRDWWFKQAIKWISCLYGVLNSDFFSLRSPSDGEGRCENLASHLTWHPR